MVHVVNLYTSYFYFEQVKNKLLFDCYYCSPHRFFFLCVHTCAHVLIISFPRKLKAPCSVRSPCGAASPLLPLASPQTLTEQSCRKGQLCTPCTTLHCVPSSVLQNHPHEFPTLLSGSCLMLREGLVHVPAFVLPGPVVHCGCSVGSVWCCCPTAPAPLSTHTCHCASIWLH